MSSDPEVIVAAVALIVSVIAFSANFMQVLQQYLASAAGYSQCNEKVMGKWADTKKRRFNWQELRFEVEFHAPVIFVSPPNNKFGPVPGEQIYFLNGTDESLDETWTDLNMDQRKAYAEKSIKERIHTADNERASWSMLLSAVQRMEKDSREWQIEQYKDIGPPKTVTDAFELPKDPPTLETHHTLTVALQRKRKSWDTMPPAVVRPYATTTMCHLIEMMAALGVYWKEFDRKHDRYHAEGNGFILLGDRKGDLLMYSFSVYGKCTFKHNRVIPVDEVKELCFGFVPTIYRETLDQRRLEFPSDEPHNLSSLQMASWSEIAETLVLVGCNNNTVQHFKVPRGKEPTGRLSHLFPISFEILGMLSRTFHIENSVFTYIPNPTPDRWDKRSLSLVKILEAYEKLFKDELDGIKRNVIIVKKVKAHIKAILNHQDKTADARLRLFKALHAALDDCDEVLTAKGRAPRDDGDVPTRPSIQARDISADKVPKESPETNKQAARREKVQDVLRSHIQEVMALLNPERDDRFWDGQSNRTSRAPSPTGQPFQDIFLSKDPTFEDMDAASPDDRQLVLMEVYFRVVRPKVVPHAKGSTTRRASIVGPPAGFTAPPSRNLRIAPSVRGRPASIRERDEDGNVNPPTPTSVRQNGTLPPTAEVHEMVDMKKVEAEPSIPPEDELKPLKDIHLADQDASHDDIWCTLVFRMICWLMLHDFNKLDVQVSKSELLGSRMPVYIS